MAGQNYISTIQLDEKSVIRRSPQVEHERKIAIFDLLEDNNFALRKGGDGPFRLKLRILIEVSTKFPAFSREVLEQIQKNRILAEETLSQRFSISLENHFPGPRSLNCSPEHPDLPPGRHLTPRGQRMTVIPTIGQGRP